MAIGSAVDDMESRLYLFFIDVALIYFCKAHECVNMIITISIVKTATTIIALTIITQIITKIIHFCPIV